MQGTLFLRVVAALALVLAGGHLALAQKRGGMMRVGHFDSPASMSLLEESTVAVNRPMMGVFNNLVVYDQHVAQNSPQSIVPDLATKWEWGEDGKDLTFALRHGVKWHDGKPFTAADVKCTWDLLMGAGKDRLRINPRKGWYANLGSVTTKGDDAVTFHLKRPQPAFLALLASGWSAIYPCHVPAAQMRQHPIGTGPFKFVEFKPNEHILVTRNPDYWKKGLPYLDGIEWVIVKNMSTRTLSFIAGKTNYLPGVTPPVLKEIKSQAPQAICEGVPANVSRNVLINRQKPPFDNAELRRAVALTIDRKAFNDILYEGKGTIGEAMLPPPAGLWGMPAEMVAKLPGYGPDIEKRRDEARKIMQKLGYAPDHHLSVKMSSRDVSYYRDPAVILIDQLKQIYIDADLQPIDTTQWYPTVMRRDFTIAINITESEVDDPDPIFTENYVCGGQRNYSNYCNKEVDQLVAKQSVEPDIEKRKHLVWQIEQKLAEDVARPILFYPYGITCWQPEVQHTTVMVNSIYNGNRFEDAWIDPGAGGQQATNGGSKK
ncbi:MAG: ABC transporter substrate-binding protein [Thiohalocapsa sp.]